MVYFQTVSHLEHIKSGLELENLSDHVLMTLVTRFEEWSRSISSAGVHTCPRLQQQSDTVLVTHLR